MNEKIEKEWIKGDRTCRGKAVGYRQFKTDLDERSCIEEVVFEIAKPMELRNQEKQEGRDHGVFAQEFLEDVFLDDDGFWRYVVSMNYLPASSQARKRSQKNKYNL